VINTNVGEQGMWYLLTGLIVVVITFWFFKRRVKPKMYKDIKNVFDK